MPIQEGPALGSLGMISAREVMFVCDPVHKSQLTAVALPKAMPMPELPKRALAAPSSMQRSKFTLAPGLLLVISLVESEHGGEEGRVGYVEGSVPAKLVSERVV